jgi:dolichol-phosphate mannosyltransferase
MRITVIIPTYNESENLPKLASEILALPIPDIQLLVVDDNSPDGTGQVADALAVRYNGRISVLHRAGKLGLRTAYIEGFKKAIAEGAEAIGQMDADFSHNPQKLVEMAKAIETHDVVIGSRYVEGGSLDESWPLWRKLLSAFGNTYARTILGIDNIRDLTSGFRMWRCETLAQMPLDRISSNGYIFLVEMAYIAYVLGFRFFQVPIHFKERVKGKSKMSLKIQLEAALKVWEVRFHYVDLKKLGIAGRTTGG